MHGPMSVATALAAAKVPHDSHRSDSFYYINEVLIALTAVQASCKRLGVATIDLYYVHRLDDRVPVRPRAGRSASVAARRV
jgi:aryl-alcohol dehydrogenase-like predicted oxidoreductase